MKSAIKVVTQSAYATFQAPPLRWPRASGGGFS
jgi:hypothetical protein